jgi:hypothetical protein
MRRRCLGTLTRASVLTVESCRRCPRGADIELVENVESLVRSLSQQVDPTCPKCGSRKAKRTVSLVGLGEASANTILGASCDTGST